MKLGVKIALGVLGLGVVGVAGAYMWMGSKSTMGTLIEAIPADTLGVVAMQNVPGVLQEYHILNGDFTPAFISAEQWTSMQEMMDLKITPQELLTKAKLNPIGISALTGSADLSTEIPKSMCAAYYLPSLSSEESAAFFKTFIEEQVGKTGMPIAIEQSDGVYSLMAVSWAAHSDWVVFSTCEDGDATSYLKQIKSAKNNLSKTAAGELLSSLGNNDWQMVGTFNLEPLHSKIDTFAKIDRDFEKIVEAVDIKSYQALGMRGYLGTGSFDMDIAVRASSADSQAMKYLSEIETTKMIDRLVGEPILVAQQGFNLQKQLDLMLAMEPLMQEQYNEAKIEFTAATGMDLEKDFVQKIGNQAGLALVHDEFLLGAEVWVELESGHKFAELANKALDEMGGMLNKEEKEGSLFLQTPPSMSDMIGIPDLSVTVGITNEEIVVAAGKSTPNDIKNMGTNSIASKMDGTLKSKMSGAKYGSAVVDFVSMNKLLSNPMVKEQLDNEMNDQEQKLFSAMVGALKNLSVTSTVQDKTITTTLSLQGTSGTAFSDIVKDHIIPELKNSF